MERTCRYLTVAEIKEINRCMVSHFGGQYQLMIPGSLEHMAEEIQGFLYGQEMHPGVFQKASFLLERLICGHFFLDGNKRTGVEACRIFLEINGYIIYADKNEWIWLAQKLSNNEMNREKLVSWISQKSIPKR